MIQTKTQNECNFNSIDEGDVELRRGPWSPEEDNLLTQYISCHGEGHWNWLAKRVGLMRTGRSCRLRWLNYLKPNIKRGNLTIEEQLLIVELHSMWGNRWSKIAQHLPGRTDNEIKNYWRTRVQKYVRQPKIKVDDQKSLEKNTSGLVPKLKKMEPSTSSSSHQPPQSSSFSLVTSSNINSEKPSHSTKHIVEDFVTGESPMSSEFHMIESCYDDNINSTNYLDPINMFGYHDVDLSNTNDQMEESNWIGDDNIDMTGDALWCIDKLW